MYDFVILCIGHLENIVSLISADIPNVDTSHFCLPLSLSFVNITTDLIRKLYVGKLS